MSTETLYLAEIYLMCHLIEQHNLLYRHLHGLLRTKAPATLAAIVKVFLILNIYICTPKVVCSDLDTPELAHPCN